MKTRKTAFNVRVKDSPIEGSGVFATKRFDTGDVIGIISGYVPEEIDPLCDYTCIFEDYHGNVYGIEPTAPFKYLNHSPYPNADWDTPVILALKDIEVGEEITIHYGDELEEVFAKEEGREPVLQEDADESD